ncbi:MAG: fluoride efflux transporter CrcB [Qingshengfaniella sp.]
MIATVLQVALGGAIGASLRHLTGVAVTRIMGTGGFPLGVLTVNVLGSFLMGLLVVMLARTSAAHLNPLLAVGVLGGFTTFSSFSLETVMLIERGALGQAMAYVVLSVGLSIGALVLGLAVARGVMA